MKKQPERTAKTRQALIDAFWKLYCERPIEKITIKDITDSAGLYRSTFYEYFQDSYAILEEIESNLLKSYDSLISNVPDIQTVAEAKELLIVFYAQNAEHIAILTGPEGDPQFVVKIKHKVADVLQNLFPNHLNSLEADLFIETAASTVISILNYWYAHKSELTMEEVLAISSKFFIHGLLPFFQEIGFDIHE